MIGRLCKPLLAVVCVLCCVAIAPALAAAAEPEPGSIEGTVTEAGMTPALVEGANVCAEEIGGGGGGCALSSDTGEYSIANLPAGEYDVLFTGQTCEEIEFEPGEFEQKCTAEWAEQYWQDVVPGNPPTPVTVAENLATGGIDAELEALGGLKGIITASGSGPIADGLICIDGDNVFHPACTLTDNTGEYTFGELPPAGYFIEFTGLVCDGLASECLSESECLELRACARSYVAQYSFGHPAFEPEELDSVPVESRQVTQVAEVTLTPAATIKGRVTVAALGDPPAVGATVCVSSNESLKGECVEVNPNGEWEVGGLATGNWFVQFRSPCTAHDPETEACTAEPLESIYYDHEVEEEDAMQIPVTAPETVSGIDEALQVREASTPAFTANPVITGNPYVGETLTCSGGSWSNYPTAIAYTWKRDVTPLPGQTSDTHTVTNADKNEALTCEVTIENEAGEVSETSNAVTVTAPPAPVFTTDPVLSGAPEVGSTLTCSPGTWTGPQATVAYGWQRSGIAIAGQTGATYLVTSADEGAALNCEALVESEGGVATAASNALSVPVKQPSNNGGSGDGGNSSSGSSSTTTSTTSTSSGTMAPAPPPSTPGTAVATATATVKGGKAMIALKCNGGACKGSLKLVYEMKTKNGKGKTVVTKTTIGSASFSLAAGAEKTVAVKLNSKGTAYVEEAGKKGLKVKLTGSGVKGRSITVKPATS
jgi:hypothetical protein